MASQVLGIALALGMFLGATLVSCTDKEPPSCVTRPTKP